MTASERNKNLKIFAATGLFLLIILSNLTFFQHLFEAVVGISSDIPDGNLGPFSFFLYILGQFFSAFLGQLREHQTDYFAIVGGIDTDI